MASYKTIQSGSTGEEVKDLQQRLRNYGYNVTVDGNFGDQTKNAVMDYQTKYGLTSDGIVGDETWASLAKSANLSVDSALDNKPGEYTPQNQEQIDNLYNQIVNRPQFSFDVGSSALYQQYRDLYTQAGQQAMQDTMGQAAGLTGGYGSSYSQGVGQQAYNAYLQQLNQAVPDIYGLAADQYNADTQQLYNLYGLAADRESQDYARYLDAYNQWLQEYNLAQQQAAMEQEQANWREEMDFAKEQWEWQKEQASRSVGSGGSSYGGSSSSGGSYYSPAAVADASGSSGDDSPQIWESTYAGGFRDTDLAGIADSYLASGLRYPIDSAEFDEWLNQFYLPSDAKAVIRQLLIDYGYQGYTGNSGGGNPNKGRYDALM